MATALSTTYGTEVANLLRLIGLEGDDLSVEAAEALLRLHLDCIDLDRLHHLVTKNQDDALTPNERGELESYLRISLFVDMMHSKVRHALKKRL